jgi:hypothetical protein
MPRPSCLHLLLSSVALSSSKEHPTEAPGEQGAHCCVVRLPTFSAVIQ